MKNIYRLFSVLGQWKWNYIGAGFLLIISSLVRMLEPKILQIAIDGIGNILGKVSNAVPDVFAQFFYDILPVVERNNLIIALLSISGLFLVLALIQALTRFIAMTLSASSTESAIKGLRDQLFKHLHALPLTHFSKVPTGETIQRCTGDIDTVRNFILTQVIEMVRLVSLFIGAVVMMLSVHVWYGLISICFSPLIMITAYLFFKYEGKVWEDHEKEQDKLTDIIQENLAGIRVVQAFAQEENEVKKFQKQNERKLEMGMRHVLLHQYFWTFSDFLVFLQIALSLVAGGYFALKGEITIGELSSFFVYVGIVSFPLRQVGRIISQMGMASVAMERIGEILDTEQEDYQGNTLVNIKGDIEFKNVKFKYSETEPYALDDVSFKVKAGEKVALIGGTGAGKSTIISLLARFYEPNEGMIYIDGQPLNTLAKKTLRSNIGIVHQKPFLFSRTIQENISFIRPDEKKEKVLEIAEAAAIGDFIDKLSDGYETAVGEKGVTLSGGQKQRVALARTLLSDPNVLVLDDATSAVDTETEYNIQQALKEKTANKTTFIIAHRLTSIQQADKIIVFEKGKILEIGTPQELLKKNGFYKKVYDIQIALEEDILK